MTTTMTDLQTGRTHVFNEALPGRDAYEEAQALGFVGSRAAWLVHLRGFAFDPASADWEVDRAYAANAAVRHDHKVWVAVVADTGTEPGTDPAVWQMLLDGAPAQDLTDAVAAALAHKGAAQTAAADAETKRAAAATILTQTELAAQALSPIEALHPTAIAIPAGWWDTGDRLLSGVSERAIIANWQHTSLFNAGQSGGVWLGTLASGLFELPLSASQAAAVGGAVGLVSDTSRVMTLGDELLPDSFSSGTWGSFGAGVSVAAGVVSFAAVAAGTIGLVLTAANGSPYNATKMFKASLTISNHVSGGLRVWTGAGYTQVFAANGVHEFYALRPADTTVRVFAPSTGAVTTLDATISVKEVTSSFLPMPQTNTGLQPKRGRMPASGIRNLLDSSHTLLAGTTINNLTVSGGVGPDGEDKLVTYNGTGVLTYLRFSNRAPAGPLNTVSVTVEADGARYFALGFSNTAADNALFDLQDGVVVTPPSNPSYTASIQALGDGWYRCGYTYTGSGSILWCWPSTTSVPPAGNAANTTGNGVAGVLIRNRQQELGPDMTAEQVRITAFDVVEAGVRSVDYVQFDQLDDAMAQVIPGGADTVWAVGPGGIYVGEAVIAEGGTLSVGGAGAVNTINGAAPGILRAVSDNTGKLFGWGAREGALSDAEIAWLERFNWANGGKGLLVPTGANLVTNGGFDTDLTGWSNLAPIRGAISWDAGELKMDATAGDGGYPVAAFSMTAMTIGVPYLIEWDARTTDGGATTGIILGSYSNAAGFSVAAGRKVIVVPTAASAGGNLYGSALKTVFFDNISVRRMIPREEL